MDTTHRLPPAQRFTDVCSNDLPTLRLATANSWACPPLPCYPDTPPLQAPGNPTRATHLNAATRPVTSSNPKEAR